MFFLLSGDGATDLGQSKGNDYQHGPMAVLLSQIVESHHGYSPLDSRVCEYVAKARLVEGAAKLKANSRKKLKLPDERQERETRYFFNNARVLAKLAIEQTATRRDDVVAVLFRDADGTASSERGEWEAKRRSMLDGFEEEGFARGVPMIPKPKSEAWLICALKESPYQDCDELEERSGNDDSPNSLKDDLEALLVARFPNDPVSRRERLNNLVEDGTIHFERITMPSFAAFRADLERNIAPHAAGPD